MNKLRRYQTQGLVASGPYAAMAQAGIGTGANVFASYMSGDGGAFKNYQEEEKTKRIFNPMMPNAWGLGIMGAYLGTSALLNQSDKHNYQAYKARWIRNYSMPSLLQDPDKFSSQYYEAPMARRGGLLGTRMSTNYQDGGINSSMNLNENPLGNIRTIGTPEQRAAANITAQRLAKKYNLMSPENVTIGKYLPQFVDPSGKPYTASPTSQLPTTLPPGVSPTAIKSDQGAYYYEDEAGDPRYLDQSVVHRYNLRLKKGGCAGCPDMADGGIHIKPENRGKFTDYCGGKVTAECIKRGKNSRSAAVRKRATFAANARKWHQDGGMTLTDPQDQAMGYYGYPNASSLTFPGNGQRTFVPGPFPLMVQDQLGTQIMTNKPVKTMGKVREIPIFQEGGEVRTQAPIVDRDDATIEAEKGEMIFGAGMPGDVEDQGDRIGVGLYSIGGNTHSQGGTPLKAYPGDFVFSNDKSLAVNEEQSKLLVGKEIKKLKLRTPAKLANKYRRLNEFIAMAQDEEQDPISKKTAILNVNNFVDRLAEIAVAQEEKKGFPKGVPAFAQASLDSRFNAQGLQEELTQFRYGGELQRYQTEGIVTPEMRAKARQVRPEEVPGSYVEIGSIGNKLYFQGPNGDIVTKPAPSATQFEKDPYKLLKTYGTRKTNPLNQYSYDDLLKQKYIGQDKPELRNYWDQFYTPSGDNDVVYTASYAATRPKFPKIPGHTPMTIPDRFLKPPTFDTAQAPPPGGGQPDDPIDNYVQGSNSMFDVNIAEGYGLLANNIPSKSRYPTAFRNWEIQNAKSLVASTGRPISEQPYLNAITRSQLGYDAANYGADPVSATRNLGAYSKSLEAQNNAISQVYNQNIVRADQRNYKLADLEVADGSDRVQNFEKYDSKLEMLANNKEMEARWRRKGNVDIINQMTQDREKLSLLNMMSDYYQVNPNRTIGFKPTYKFVNGKLQPYQRNIGDMIKSSGSITDQRALDRMRQVFELMQQYNIRSGSFVDELINQSVNPGPSYKF